MHQLSSGGQGKYSELKDEGKKLDMLHDNFVTSYSYSYLLPPSQK